MHAAKLLIGMIFSTSKCKYCEK